MRRLEYGRPALARDETCSACALWAEREVVDLVGDTQSERWQVGDKTVEVKGLPPLTCLDDTTAEHADKPVPDSVLYAPDAQREFMLRHAG